MARPTAEHSASVRIKHKETFSAYKTQPESIWIWPPGDEKESGGEGGGGGGGRGAKKKRLAD